MHDLGSATTVEAEPLTADDWEILVRPPSVKSLDGLKLVVVLQELHASHVEGTFLSQVRVAFTGQEINVWVLGRTRVRLKVG